MCSNNLTHFTIFYSISCFNFVFNFFCCKNHTLTSVIELSLELLNAVYDRIGQITSSMSDLSGYASLISQAMQVWSFRLCRSDVSGYSMQVWSVRLFYAGLICQAILCRSDLSGYSMQIWSVRLCRSDLSGYADLICQAMQVWSVRLFYAGLIYHIILCRSDLSGCATIIYNIPSLILHLILNWVQYIFCARITKPCFVYFAEY